MPTNDARDARLEAARDLFARLVASQSGALAPRLAAALRAVPREAFAGPKPWHITLFEAGKPVHIPINDAIHLYQDVLIALDREKGINNGEPVLHGRMLGALAPAVGSRVLHIGCGGGFYTAILAELAGPAGRVDAYDIEPAIAALARQNLSDRPNVHVHAVSATESPLPEADAIYVNAGATRPHVAWLVALADGGRLVFPLASTTTMGATMLVERRGEGFAARVAGTSAFIRCAGAHDTAEGDKVGQAIASGNLFRTRSLVRASPSDDTVTLVGADWWFSSRALPT